MRVNTLSIGVRVASAIFAVDLLVTGALGAAKETVLHNFKDNHTDGATPNGFIFDAAGNLYGTTEGGGSVA